MRAREALKAQGVRHQEYRWPRLESELFCMAGNAMNFNVVVWIFEVLLPHLGFQVPSPGDHVLQKETEPAKVNQSLPSTAKGYNEYQRRKEGGDYLNPINLRMVVSTMDVVTIAKLQAKLGARLEEGDPVDSRNESANRMPHYFNEEGARRNVSTLARPCQTEGIMADEGIKGEVQLSEES